MIANTFLKVPWYYYTATCSKTSSSNQSGSYYSYYYRVSKGFAEGISIRILKYSFVASVGFGVECFRLRAGGWRFLGLGLGLRVFGVWGWGVFGAHLRGFAKVLGWF